MHGSKRLISKLSKGHFVKQYLQKDKSFLHHFNLRLNLLVGLSILVQCILGVLNRIELGTWIRITQAGQVQHMVHTHMGRLGDYRDVFSFAQPDARTLCLYACYNRLTELPSFIITNISTFPEYVTLPLYCS